jgi:hypothetical protein
MATTLTNGSASIAPKQVLGFESTRTAGTKAHAVLGQSAPAVTFAPMGLRSGSLKLLVANLADALAAEALHAQIGICHLIDTDLPLLNMNYVVNGSVTIALEEETRLFWTVSVDFQQVT